jgi:DNA integrity scanning protein DisA with diadenylate cyclase activity
VDISGLPVVLLNAGPWGAVVLWLLWDRHNLTQRLDACQKAYTADLLRIVGEVTKAVVASTEATRTSTAAQERATDAHRQLAEAIKVLQASITGLERDIERLDREGA